MPKVEPVPRELTLFSFKAHVVLLVPLFCISLVKHTERGGLWVFMPSVDDNGDKDVAGLFLTRHILVTFDCLLFFGVICFKNKDSRHSCVRSREAHGFSPNLPHTGTNHTTECTSTMRRKQLYTSIQ